MSILKTQYENETDIPAGYSELFTEQNGKWLITGIEGMKTIADVNAVTVVNQKLRKQISDLEAKSKKLEKLGDKDIDQLVTAAAEAEELRARVEELEAEGGKGAKPGDEEVIQRRIETAVKKATGPLQRQLVEAQNTIAAAKKEAEEHKTTATNLDGKIRRSTIEGEITRAAVAANVEKASLRDVLMYRDIFEVNEEGKVTTRDGVGVTPGLDPASWLSERRSDSNWWPPSVGGGARGGDGRPLGDNPFDKKNPNVSKAMQLEATDAAKALQLARAAGYASLDVAYEAMGETDGKSR